MKISLLLCLILLNIAFVFAEQTYQVKFYRNNSLPPKLYNLQDIDKIQFKNISNTYIMKFHYQDSLTSYYPIKNIDTVKFELDTNNIQFLNAYVFGAPKSFLVSEIDSIVFKQIETIIADNVYIIDSTLSREIIYIDSTIIIFDSSSTMIKNRIIGDIVTSGPLDLAPNGFSRKIVSKYNQSDSIIVETEDAKITDVIKSGIISFSKKFTPQDTIPSRINKNDDKLQAEEGFTIGFEDILVYDYDGNSDTEHDQIKIDGSNTFTPDIGFNLAIENGEIKQLLFQLYIRNKLGLTAHTNLEYEKKIKKSVNQLLGIPPIRLPAIVIPVGPCPLCIPITITSNIDLQIGIELTIGAEASTTVEVENTAVAGIEYNSGTWKPIADFTTGFKFEPPKLSLGGSLKAFLGPQLNINFFNLQDAFNAYAGVFGFLELEIQLLEKPLWELWAGLEAKAGVQSKWWPVLDYESPLLIEFRDLLGKSTNLIDTITPLNAKVGDTLTILGSDVFGLTRGVNTIKFQFGKSLLPVDCITATDYPLWNPDTIKVIIPQGITTDSVQILLDLGGLYSNQYGYKLSGAEVVTIGEQTWMLKNLNVELYRNGDSIRFAKSNADWVDAGNKKEGAWCYFNNDSTNGEIYGKLYNWFAVDDSRGLAPDGYKVPSDVDWTVLSNYLGGEDVAGSMMKETGTVHWSDPNDDATNSSGFTGLPGGFRNFSGGFFDFGKFGYWWSSTGYNGEWYYACGIESLVMTEVP